LYFLACRLANAIGKMPDLVARIEKSLSDHGTSHLLKSGKHPQAINQHTPEEQENSASAKPKPTEDDDSFAIPIDEVAKWKFYR
jgi:hypothetical protein